MAFSFFPFGLVGFCVFEGVAFVMLYSRRVKVRLSRKGGEDFGDGDGESRNRIDKTSQSGWYIKWVPLRYMKEKEN